MLASISLLSINVNKAQALTFVESDVGVTFKAGELGTIEVKIKGQAFNFTNNITYEGLRQMGNFRPSSFTYSYGGTGLCQPDPSSSGYNQSIPKSEIRVAFTNVPSSGPVLATAYVLIYSGNSSTACNIVSPSSGTIGFNRNLTYTPTVPPGQGSGFTDPKFAGASFKFVDGATIEASLPNKNGGKVTVRFTDSNPVDDKREFLSDTSEFCGNKKGRISFDNSDQGNNSIPLEVQLFYYTSAGLCTATEVLKNFNVANPGKIATKVLQWNVANIESIGTTSITFNPRQETSGPSQTVFVSGSGCSGYGVKLDNDNSGTLYDLNGAGSSNGPFPNCSVSSRSVLIEGKRGEPPVNDPDADPSGSGENEDNCYTLGSTGLEWFFCAVLAGIDKAVKEFYEEVEDQLCVKAGISTTAGGTDDTGQAINPCGKDSGNYLNDDTKAIWSAVRVIATSLLVIAMLVMVIGTAIRGNNV